MESIRNLLQSVMRVREEQRNLSRHSILETGSFFYH